MSDSWEETVDRVANQANVTGVLVLDSAGLPLAGKHLLWGLLGSRISLTSQPEAVRTKNRLQVFSGLHQVVTLLHLRVIGGS